MKKEGFKMNKNPYEEGKKFCKEIHGETLTDRLDDEVKQDLHFKFKLISANQKNKIKNDFTMIELMVVISIIMILASMLLPALRNAKDSARRVACLGSIRQLGTATIAYATDYNGYYPAGPHIFQAANGGIVETNAAGTAAIDDEGFYYFSSQAVKDAMMLSESSFWCPSDIYAGIY